MPFQTLYSFINVTAHNHIAKRSSSAKLGQLKVKQVASNHNRVSCFAKGWLFVGEITVQLLITTTDSLAAYV